MHRPDATAQRDGPGTNGNVSIQYALGLARDMCRLQGHGRREDRHEEGKKNEPRVVSTMQVWHLDRGVNKKAPQSPHFALTP